MDTPPLDDELKRISDARHQDPFAVLGRHPDGKQTRVRVFNPQAEAVSIADGNLPLEHIPGTDFFEWRGDGDAVPVHYRLAPVFCLDIHGCCGYPPIPPVSPRWRRSAQSRAAAGLPC